MLTNNFSLIRAQNLAGEIVIYMIESIIYLHMKKK